MNLKKIISGLTAGVIAASIGISAFAAEFEVTWSNDTTLETAAGKSATSTGTFKNPISEQNNVATATFAFDLLLKGPKDDPSYLALKSGGENVVSIKRDGWSSKSYTVAEQDVIIYNSSDIENPVAAHHFVIKLDFVNDKYEVTGTKTENNKKTVDGSFTVDSIDELILYAGHSSASNVAAIKNLKITTTDITEAGKYTEYTIVDGEKTDAKGFVTENFTSKGVTVNELSWYLRNGTHPWTYLTTLKDTEITTTGDIQYGLIVYDLPDDVTAENISAGYTYE